MFSFLFWAIKEQPPSLSLHNQMHNNRVIRRLRAKAKSIKLLPRSAFGLCGHLDIATNFRYNRK